MIGGTTYNYAGGTPTGVVSVGAAGVTRQIQNVAAGQVTASSTDAVNGSQLFATNSQVTANTTSISNLASQITNISGGAADAVVYDSSSHNSVTLGGVGASSPVALHNVAAGALNATSTDAVNSSQLYALVSSTANAMGGGLTVNPDGSITNPTYVVNGGTYTNVAGVVTNLDGRVTQNTSDIQNITNNINNGTIGLVQQATLTSTVAKDTGGKSVDFTGTEGARTLTGVAAGDVSASSVDTVNGSQLYGIQQTITNITGQVANAVSYDTPAKDSITLGGTDSTKAVSIHNLAAGDVSATSLDTVNGSQLYNIQTQLDNVTNIAENATDPMFTANGNRNTEAASAIGQHATAGGANANASGDQSTAMGANSVASATNASAFGANAQANVANGTAIGAGATVAAGASNSVALGQGSVATEANTVSVGSDSLQRRITNVAAGVNGTDAVNVDQLNQTIDMASGQAVQQANAYTNQQIGMVRKQVNTLGAAAMAASSLVPNARAEGNFQMSAAVGTYGGESALAVGANWYVSDRLLVNAHLSKSTGGGTGASVGATFGF